MPRIGSGLDGGEAKPPEVRRGRAGAVRFGAQLGVAGGAPKIDPVTVNNPLLRGGDGKVFLAIVLQPPRGAAADCFR
jgi:hypothetical protein